jgi:hypothetical protein
VTVATGRGSFVYVGTTVDSEPSLIRLDLGMPVEEGRYAYAPDLRVPIAGTPGVVSGITVDSSGLLRFAVQDYGVIAEESTYSGRDAWLRTGRIRMTTVEPKRYKRARVRSEGTGTFTVSAETDATAIAQVYDANAGDGEEFDLPNTRAEWVQLTIELTGDTRVTSYQVLALPAQPRQRLFSLPVALYDNEINRHQRKVGYPGRAKELMNFLEGVELAGDEVTVQCPVLGIDAVRCTIERIEFAQQSAPTANKTLELGGTANLIFRTVS